LAVLSQAFLDLSSKLMDRTEYMRSFAAHVSHELKSPLTAIKGSAELIRDEGDSMTPAQRHKFLNNIVKDADRLTQLVARLRELAQAEMPAASGTTTLGVMLPSLQAQFPSLKISFLGEDVAITLPAETLGIVLAHLASNSEQHGATHFTANAIQDQDRLWITISDDGSGISEGNRDRIFQPFFTTRREWGGTGVGLDIVRAMLQSHNAEIKLVHSTKGASFRIYAPGRQN
jgi:signal transduction histidine kinase